MTTDTVHNRGGWLYSPGFDSFFIFGIAIIAVVFGMLGLVIPPLYEAILLINLWLLGYHHVIATFTRLCFDKQSHRQSLLLIYALIPAVGIFVFGLVQAYGLWTIATMYLYGQWFHYSRQSWGVSRAYERTAPKGYTADRSWQTQIAFYGFPLWGILSRSHEQPQTFLSMPIKTLNVPIEVVNLVGGISVFFFALWLVRVYKDWKQGVLPVAYVCYMLSHFGIFIFAYILMPNLDSGWLVANIWHNTQYLAFVWLFNNRLYRQGVTKEAPLLSFLSQAKNTWLYFAITFAISTALYMGLRRVFPDPTLAIFVTVYMTINFHHYIVDAIIWRVSWIKKGKPPVAPTPT